MMQMMARSRASRVRSSVAVVMTMLAIGTAFVRLAGGSRDSDGALQGVLGRQLSPVTLVSGQTRSVENVEFRSQAPQLLLIYSRNCGASIKARPRWEELVSRLAGKVPVYGISIDNPATVEPEGRFFGNALVEEWFADPPVLARLLPIHALPVTIVLSPDGRIELAETGVPTDNGMKALARLLVPSSG